MSGDIKTEGEKNITVKDVSGSTVIIYQQPPSEDKKSSSVQKFYPKNFQARLTYFTGREIVLEKTAEALEKYGTAAFADTHGVGKSSVVNEFAYRNQENYEHILFIRATNNEFNIYVSDIVKDLGFDLPEEAKPEERLAVLQDWLAKNQNWLLLVDNVDDVDFIHKCGFNKPSGKVIYTSNNDKVFKVGTKVELPKMTEENAILLLYKHWQDKPDTEFKDIPEKVRETLKGISEKFGNHPFSMAFVGSYLAEEDESLDEFLEAYSSKEKNLLEKYKFLSGYEHENVAAAFLLRFEQISTPKDKSKREKFLSIAVEDYLKLSAFVGTDNIPEELLQMCLALLHQDQLELVTDEAFIKEIYKRFRPTSIFKRDPENKTLSTHRIVQEIMRFQIKDDEITFLETLARVLYSNFKKFDFTNKEKVERYLTHVGVFLEYLEQGRENDKAILKLENESSALLCNRYAFYYEAYGNYIFTEKYWLKFKEICERNKAIDRDFLGMSYNNLASLYHAQGKYKQAELLYEKSIEIRIKVLGEHHPEIAITYGNLAGIYEGQKDYEKAEPLRESALEIHRKILGENHPHTATSYNNLASLYQSEEKYKESESLYKKALEIHERIAGKNHPDTARCYNNLASLYFQTGNLELAKEYQRKSLKACLANFDENHPLVAVNYWWLGLFYEKEEKYQDALDHLSKAREIYLQFLPEEHPTIRNLQNYVNDCERLVKK